MFIIRCLAAALAKPDESPFYLAALRLCVFALILDCMVWASARSSPNQLSTINYQLPHHSSPQIRFRCAIPR